MDGEDKAMGFFPLVLACLPSVRSLFGTSINQSSVCPSRCCGFWLDHSGDSAAWNPLCFQTTQIPYFSTDKTLKFSACFFVCFVFFFRKIPTTTKEWFMSVLGYFALLGLALGLNSTRIYPSDCWFADSKRDHFTVYTISPFWTPVAVDDGRNHSSSYLN